MDRYKIKSYSSRDIKNSENTYKLTWGQFYLKYHYGCNGHIQWLYKMKIPIWFQIEKKINK